jgi:hypothetical protein
LEEDVHGRRLTDDRSAGELEGRTWKMGARRPTILGAALLVLPPSVYPLAAQGARSEGLWSDVGLGLGWDVTDAANVGALGLVWRANVGITIDPHLRLGLELATWDRWDPPASSLAKASNMAVDVIALPSGTLGGLHGKVGLGISDADLWNGTFNRLDHPWGFGATMGIGYGIRVAGTDYLSARFEWLLQVFGSERGRSSVNHVLTFNVAVTSP